MKEIMFNESAISEEQRQKILKEVDLLKEFEHPSIVRLRESFIENNNLYIIMDFEEG
jgi:serine/threonine protein kinase